MNNEPVPHCDLKKGKEYYAPYCNIYDGKVYYYKYRGVSGCLIEIKRITADFIEIITTTGGCQDPHKLEPGDIIYELGSAMHESYLLELQVNGVKNKVDRLMEDIRITDAVNEIWENTLQKLTALKDA